MDKGRQFFRNSLDLPFFGRHIIIHCLKEVVNEGHMTTLKESQPIIL